MIGGLRSSSVRILLIIFAIFALVYGLFEARRIIEGPTLTLTSPQDGSAVTGPLVHISGTAQNISYLSIDGAQAFADKEGHFSKLLSPAPGYTVVTVSGRDRFGRIQTKTAHISIVNYCPIHAEV